MFLIRFTVLLALIIFSATGLFAQERLVDDQLWVNYALGVKTKSNWSYGGDVAWRSSLDNGHWNLFLVRPTAAYKINSTLKASAGAALFFTRFNELGDVYEYRLQQEISAKWPRFTVGHFMWRFRLDERWLNYEFQPTQFDLRGRLLAGFQTTDIVLANNQAIYALSLVEGFRSLNAEKPTVLLMNRDRIHVALGYRLSANLRIEVHYIWQMSVKPLLEDLETTERVIRIRLFHNL
jgi:hypothetical protein